MKSFLIILFVFALSIGFSNSFLFASDVASVTNIGSTSTSQGADAYRVVCTSGNEYVIEPRDGKWHWGVVWSELGVSGSASPDTAAEHICRTAG